jgi:hypothetical protein
MAEPTPPGIALTRPGAVKETAQTLLGGLFLPVAKLAGAATGFGAAVEGLAEIIKRFRPEDTLSEKGWRLVYGALAQAIGDAAAPLRALPAPTERLPVEHLMQLGGSRIDFDTITIEPHFLRQPKTLRLLDEIGPILEGALQHFDLDEDTARRRAALLPGLFVAALADFWQESPEGLEALEGLTDSAPALAEQQERFWPYYRDRLARELARPLFAGPLSLLDLYQPLRGYWRERKKAVDREDGAVHHVVDLKAAFDAWLDESNRYDAIRVVTGGPGSGKSSFVKHWAVEVLTREQRLPTLVVPLHRLRSFELEQEIGRFAFNEGFAKNPLGLHDGEPRLLLILDGLDELDADRTRGPEAAGHLVAEVMRLIDERNRDGCRLQIVLAGRELVVSALTGELSDDRQVVHALGYLDHEKRRELGDATTRAVEWQDPAHLLTVDQRQQWWQNWARLTGKDHPDVPEAIAGNRQLAELSDQPLLNHLLAITHARTPEAIDSRTSINGVYASILTDVFQRSWGVGDRIVGRAAQLPGLRRLREADFKRVFESIGLAVWQNGGGRSITLREVETIADAEGVREPLSLFTEAARRDAFDLLTAFYFRREGAEATFELTHKSFGEYFAALRLCRLVHDLHRWLAEDEIDGEEALRRWYRWTHAARITQEILAFVEGELRELSVDEIGARRGTLIRLFDRNLRTGMAHLTIDGVAAPAHFRDAQGYDAAAELALVTVLGACSAVLIEKTATFSDDERRTIVGWSPAWPDRDLPERTSAWDLLRRLEAGTARDSIVRRYMMGMDLTQQIVRTHLLGAGWRLAAAKSANLSGANLLVANLSGADLSGADLGQANLSGADLSHANLSHANLSFAKLRHANLSFANLSRAKLVDADLRGNDLSDAKGLTRKQLAAARSIEGAKLPNDLPDE